MEPAPIQLVEIFFDTATYDEIERDVKVICHSNNYTCCRHVDWLFCNRDFEGDYRGPAGADRWHHGTSHRIFNPQLRRDRLLCH